MNKIIVLGYYLFLCSALIAQTTDYGFWTSVELEKKLGKWDFEMNTELRTINKSTEFHRWSIDLETSYKIIKPIKAGIGYSYMYFNDLEYTDLQPRQRYILYIQGKQKFGNFKFTLREQFQRTIKDESDRITESGFDNYKINPLWIWRNRLKAEYNIPKFPVTPSLSIESFYILNNPEGNAIKAMRYKLSFKYKITKHHRLTVYGLIDNEINAEDPYKICVGGLKYTYSF